jgi:predicted nucleic acid-binding protein
MSDELRYVFDTGDQDLLVLNPFHGISIITPTAFLSALAE